MKSSYNNTHPVFMKQNKKRIRVKLHAFFCFPFLLPTDFTYLCPQEEKMKILKEVTSIVKS